MVWRFLMVLFGYRTLMRLLLSWGDLVTQRWATTSYSYSTDQICSLDSDAGFTYVLV